MENEYEVIDEYCFVQCINHRQIQYYLLVIDYSI